MNIKIERVLDCNLKIDVDAMRLQFDEQVKSIIEKEAKKKKKNSGSKIAKSGFKSEIDAVGHFSDWKNSLDALEIIGQMCHILSIDLQNIEYVKAYLWKDFPLLTAEESKLKHKTDIFIVIKVFGETIEHVCAVSQKRSTIGLNQLDRRWVDSYKEILGIPDDIARLLKFFTGELPPSQYLSSTEHLEDQRRLYISEMKIDDQNKISAWFKENMIEILKFGFLGKESKFSPNFLLVEKVSDEGSFYRIIEMKDAMNLYAGNGEVYLSRDGNIYLGSPESREAIVIKRKGGDNGAESAKNLQISFNPNFIFDLDNK